MDTYFGLLKYMKNILETRTKYKWSTRLQSMYNYMVGRTVSVISPFYSLLPGKDTEIRYSDLGAKNLMTGYRYENQLQNPGFTNGVY